MWRRMRWGRRPRRPRAISRVMSSRCSTPPLESWSVDRRATARAAARARDADGSLVADATKTGEPAAAVARFARTQGEVVVHVHVGRVGGLCVCACVARTIGKAEESINEALRCLSRVTPPLSHPKRGVPVSVDVGLGACVVRC